MNATILNYPGFHRLPKAIRQMLVTSEDHFFTDAQPEIGDQKQPDNAGTFCQPSCPNEGKGEASLAMQKLAGNFPRKKAV